MVFPVILLLALFLRDHVFAVAVPPTPLSLNVVSQILPNITLDARKE